MHRSGAIVDLVGHAFTIFVKENLEMLEIMYEHNTHEVPFPVFCYVQFGLEYERVTEI